MAEKYKHEWQQEAEKLRPIVDEEQKHFVKMPLRVLGVNQLDAIILDHELNEVLKIQFNKIFSLFPGQFSGYGPELSLILDLIVFYYSVWKRGTTYGNQLQGLKYKLSSNPSVKNLTLIAYLILNVIVPYVFNRMSLKARQWVTLQEDDPRKKFWFAISKCDEIWKYLSFINFVVFLYDGKYVSLANRLLRLRLIYEAARARSVSFEFMNRQLLWNGFTEFMFFLMPLIKVSSLKDMFGNMLLKIWGDGSIISQNQCPICKERPNIPYCDASNNCHHLFCYFCIKRQLMDQGSYTCTDGKITTITRWAST